MRSMFITISVVALLAISASSAAARQDVPPNRIDAGSHAATMRSLGARQDGLPDRVDAGSHAATMRSLGVHHRQLATISTTVEPANEPTRAPIVRSAPAPGGFEWADAGIGAGLALALLLGAAGASAVRRHPTMTTH